MRLAIKQHLQTLDTSEIKHEITYHNVYGNTRRLRDLNFDAVILHTTFLCMRWSHLFYLLKWELRWIKDIPCKKIAIPQDEYDHSEILDEWMYEWQAAAIFSCFDKDTCKILYPIMHDRASIYPALTGYIDEATARNIESRLLKIENRPNDIVYRASQLPYWFGSHGQLKHQIGGVFSEQARLSGLTCDISTRETDTVVGESWLDFMASGKTTIGCESGSSVLDRRGEIQTKIRTLLRDKPTDTFEQVASRLPQGWDDFSFFAISPRHLEAIITKTCQILVEGSYSGILKPDLHYIPVKRDFSNLKEVVEKIKNTQLLQEIAERAYEDIYLSKKYSYQAFASQIEQAIN
jgi:hypothetical protein